MKKFLFIFLLFLTVYIFRHWFIMQSLGGLDYFHFWPERLREFGLNSYLWDSTAENGLGDNIIKVLWVDRYLQIVVSLFVSKLGFSWSLVQRLFWLWPYLILSLVSPYLFLKKILPESGKNIFLPLGILVFSFNTYILMTVSGGQINLGIAYALAPLTLSLFIRLTTYDLSNNNLTSYILSLKSSIIAGLVLAIQALFDLRLAYVTMIAVGVYPILKIKYQKSKLFILNAFLLISISLLVTAGLHSFWLLPQMLWKSSPLPPGYNNTDWLSYLSWAKFPQTLSLLHPNWPENIFGKTYFMRAEFLFIPILAYSALLFINSNIKNQKDKIQINNQKLENDKLLILQYPNILISFFVLLGLIGTFLAKGVNPPFGEAYNWMFSHIPLFVLFRDPTKFYLLIALAYMVLIPLSLFYLTSFTTAKLRIHHPSFWGRAKRGLQNLKDGFWTRLRKGYAGQASRNDDKNIRYVVAFLFLIYWLFLLLPILSGQVKGTLATRATPKEYYQLEKFLVADKEFSRILWVPQADRDSFMTNNHPTVNADKLFDNTNLPDILRLLKNKNAAAELQNLTIKYVAIPKDSDAQIFLTDRKYDAKLKQNTEATLDKLPYLEKLKEFNNNLAVYKVRGEVKGHFFLKSKIKNQKSKISYRFINPAKYEVQVENGRKGDVLVFAERYDSGWKAKLIGTPSVILGSPSTSLGINSATPESDSGPNYAKATLGRQARMTKSEDVSTKLNSFILPQTGNYSLEVYYEPQKYVPWGNAISLISLAFCLTFLIGLRVKKGTT